MSVLIYLMYIYNTYIYSQLEPISRWLIELCTGRRAKAIYLNHFSEQNEWINLPESFFNH